MERLDLAMGKSIVKKRCRDSVSILFAIAWALALRAGGAAAAPPVDLEQPLPRRIGSTRVLARDGKVTVIASDASLADLVEEIGQRCGASVRWPALRPTAKISLTFADLPVAEAIGRILRGRSFLLSYSGGSPSSILVLSSPADLHDTPTTVSGNSTGEPDVSLVSESEPETTIDPDDLVPSALGELETIADAAAGDVQIAIQVAMSSPDSWLRGRALRALARHQDQIPMANDVFLSVYHQDSDAEIRKLALTLSKES